MAQITPMRFVAIDKKTGRIIIKLAAIKLNYFAIARRQISFDFSNIILLSFDL